MSSQDYRIEECDVLIIGGGGSGVIAGIEASAQTDLKIILVSKGPIGKSGLTPTANGGTHAAPLEIMFQRGLIGGNFLNDQKILSSMISSIPESLEKLKLLGISITPFSKYSVCIPGTSTLDKLRKIIVTKPNITLFEDVLITSLITSERKIAGAAALDIATGEFFVIRASAVILATGGLVGELYPYSSNNPFGVTTAASGTGHIMAYLAGAELVDMEMIQFCPLPANPRCLNLRYFPEFWDGPYLNRFNDAFESDPDSYLDGTYSYLFVQKMFREIRKGNGPIYIDHRGLEKSIPQVAVADWISRRKRIKLLGIDPLDNKIEITLGSHFGMGGIRINEKTETSVPGLYAAGENMGGVHGAMRVSGFSFAQMVVFGFVAGQQVVNYVRNVDKDSRCFSSSETEAEKEKVFGFLDSKNPSVSVNELRKRLQQVMQDQVFVFRNAAGLENALYQIKEIKRALPQISVPNFKRFNLDWCRAIEFSLMIEAAEIIVQSALLREESRGCHYREDFPHIDNKTWLRHTMAKLETGHLRISTVPVDLSLRKPDQNHE